MAYGCEIESVTIGGRTFETADVESVEHVVERPAAPGWLVGEMRLEFEAGELPEFAAQTVTGTIATVTFDHFGGVLTMTMHDTWVPAFDMALGQFDIAGHVRKLEYAKGGGRTAWEPQSVTVGFCVNVERSERV